MRNRTGEIWLFGDRMIRPERGVVCFGKKQAARGPLGELVERGFDVLARQSWQVSRKSARASSLGS